MVNLCIIKDLRNILPIATAEHDCIISAQGDITIAYSVQLPEIFTLSQHDYESLHQTLIRGYGKVRVMVRKENMILGMTQLIGY